MVNNVVVHPVTPHRLPPRQVIEEHEPMHETVDLNLTTGIKMSEFMNDTDIMTPSPKRVSYCKTPSHDLPPGFSPFVRTIMGRLERIEDKLDEQCLSMSQLNQTTGNALMNLQSTSPAAEQIIDLTTTEQSLSTNTEQAAVHTSLVQRPFYSVPFLADKKVSIQVCILACLLLVICLLLTTCLITTTDLHVVLMTCCMPGIYIYPTIHVPYIFM